MWLLVKKLFALWIDGLATALIQAETLFRRPQSFRLIPNTEQLTLYKIGEFGLESVWSSNSTEFDQLPQQLRIQTTGSTVEIPVPAAAIQVRRLDVLPAESLPYVEKVVSHQLETLFPWPSADTLHATTIESRTDGNLDVLVRATSRSAIAPALTAATAIGAGEILIVDDSEDANNQRHKPIIASIGSEYLERQKRAQLIARYAVIGLLGFGVCALSWSIFTGWSLTSDISSLDQEIADRRAILQRNASSAGAAQNRGLEAKRRNTPLAVVVLDKLSAILPDDTYLTDFSLETGHLRISGVTANAAALVPLLEGSGQFKDASSAAPTTRIAGGALDRFSIEAVVLPTVEGKP